MLHNFFITLNIFFKREMRIFRIRENEVCLEKTNSRTSLREFVCTVAVPWFGERDIAIDSSLYGKTNYAQLCNDVGRVTSLFVGLNFLKIKFA